MNHAKNVVSILFLVMFLFNFNYFLLSRSKSKFATKFVNSLNNEDIFQEKQLVTVGKKVTSDNEFLQLIVFLQSFLLLLFCLACLQDVRFMNQNLPLDSNDTSQIATVKTNLDSPDCKSTACASISCGTGLMCYDLWNSYDCRWAFKFLFMICSYHLL